MFEYLKNKYKYADIEKPLTIDAVHDISQICLLKLGNPLPMEYSIFLSEMNGFYCNGYSIFGCYNKEMISCDHGLAGLDFISFNERFRDYSEIDNLLIIGKSSIDYIAYELITKQYVLITNGTLDELYRSDSFSLIVSRFLENL